MKILLVEDNSKHREDAEQVLNAAGVEFLYARNVDLAEQILRNNEENGITHVMTDLFMPFGRAGYSNGDNEGRLEPCGLSVALFAEEMGLPFVICTDGHHHGVRYDWITMLGRRRNWPYMVDNVREHTDVAKTKDWAGALKLLTGIQIPIAA
ncbi:MAG: response regulator [Candidatus Paceibacterota bacterium]